MVLNLVNEMCGYINENWNISTPVHLSSYAMWRMNWIHPFFGGNGRTARALSYLVLCAKLGFILPGEKTIPELIVSKRNAYLSALQQADETLAQGALSLAQMEDLMSSLIAEQLVAIHERATGQPLI